MKTLHATHLSTLVLGMALAYPAVVAAESPADDTSRYDDKGGAITQPVRAHASSEYNYGAINQGRMVEQHGYTWESPTKEGSASGDSSKAGKNGDTELVEKDMTRAEKRELESYGRTKSDRDDKPRRPSRDDMGGVGQQGDYSESTTPAQDSSAQDSPDQS